MHIIVPVDQEVPKRLGVAPGDRRVPGLHSGIYSIASLADDLQLPNHRTLFFVVLRKHLPGDPTGIAFNALAGVPHVDEIQQHLVLRRR